MTLSAENYNRRVNDDSLLDSAAATMAAAADTLSPHRRRRDTRNALAILEEAKVNALRDGNEPAFYTADTMASIAPIYGFKRYFRDHVHEGRYVEAFAASHLEPTQQSVRKVGLETMEVFASVEALIGSTEGVNPNALFYRRQRGELLRTMAYQAAVLECLDPDEPQAFARITLPDYLKINK